MLDNMKPEKVTEAIRILKEKGLREKVIVELSGGINEGNLQNYASLGADVISSGALTHSYKSADLSLDIIK